MDVLTALRLAEWEVPVVIITGNGDGELRANAGTLGAAIVLEKPFELDTLRELVRILSLPPRTVWNGNDHDDDDDVTLVSARPAQGGRS